MNAKFEGVMGHRAIVNVVLVAALVNWPLVAVLLGASKRRTPFAFAGYA